MRASGLRQALAALATPTATAISTNWETRLPTRTPIQTEDEGPDGYGGEYYSWWWDLYGYSGWNEPSCRSGACEGSGVQSATPVPENYSQAGYDFEDGDCAD